MIIREVGNSLAHVKEDRWDRLLTIAEVGELVGADIRSVKLAVRRGLLAAVSGESDELRIARAALDEFMPPAFQEVIREWRKYEGTANRSYLNRFSTPISKQRPQ